MMLHGATLSIEFCCKKWVRYRLSLYLGEKISVTQAICISFNCSKAALQPCITNLFLMQNFVFCLDSLLNGCRVKVS